MDMDIEPIEIPTGFALTLSMNPDAMKKFAALDEARRRAVIEGMHTIHSKDEMQRYISDFASDNQSDTRG